VGGGGGKFNFLTFFLADNFMPRRMDNAMAGKVSFCLFIIFLLCDFCLFSSTSLWRRFERGEGWFRAFFYVALSAVQQCNLGGGVIIFLSLINPFFNFFMCAQLPFIMM
jgi:hypothetical protein